MDFPAGVPVVRLRAGRAADPYSDQPTGDLDWTAPEELTFPRCAFWQESSAPTPPIDQRRDQVVTVTKVVLPYGADVLPDDRFRVNGNTYQVQGEPQQWHHPATGWEPGCVVTGVWIDG